MKLDLSRFDGVAFDFDGTLADTYAAHTQARLTSFAAHGLPNITEEQHARGHIYGSTPYTIIAGVLKEAGVIPADADPNTHPLVLAITKTKNEHYKELGKGGLDAQPGALELLDKVAAYFGSHISIATTARNHEVMPFLRRHNRERYFSCDRIIDEETLLAQGLAMKPAPDAYILAAERMGIQPQLMLAIEDSPRGVESAKRAGSLVLAVGYANGREVFYDSALSYSPDLFVPSLSDVEIA